MPNWIQTVWYSDGFQYSVLLSFMFLFCLVFAMFCARLFICALWSPAGKGLTSWLSFVVSSVSLSLSHWYPGSGVVLDCIDSWSLHHFLPLRGWCMLWLLKVQANCINTISTQTRSNTKIKKLWWGPYKTLMKPLYCAFEEKSSQVRLCSRVGHARIQKVLSEDVQLSVVFCIVFCLLVDEGRTEDLNNT